MRLSFENQETLKEAVGSICFNNPPSDPNTIPTIPQMGSSSMPPQGQERSEDIYCDHESARVSNA